MPPAHLAPPSPDPDEIITTSCGFCGASILTTRQGIRDVLAGGHGLFDAEADELIAQGIRPAYCTDTDACQKRMPDWERKQEELRLQPLPPGKFVCVYGPKGWCATSRASLPHPSEGIGEPMGACGASPKFAWLRRVQEPTCPDCASIVSQQGP